jgi:hypothetical protein
MYTLREWQQLEKDLSSLIVGASAIDGSDSWTPWPIGMTPKFTGPVHNGPHDKLLFCGISARTDSARRPNAPNRTSILKTLASKGIWNKPYADNNYYYSQLPKFKFVISPEGNGIDTHRTYEALVAGCIPIVEECSKMREKYCNMPILWTTDYSEINNSYITIKYNDMIDQTYDFSPLFLDFYAAEEQESIRVSSAYWNS